MKNNVFYNTENWKEDDIWTFFDNTGLRKGIDFVGVDFLRGKFVNFKIRPICKGVFGKDYLL